MYLCNPNPIPLSNVRIEMLLMKGEQSPITPLQLHRKRETVIMASLFLFRMMNNCFVKPCSFSTHNGFDFCIKTQNTFNLSVYCHYL